MASSTALWMSLTIGTDAEGSTRADVEDVVARNGAFSTRLCACGEEEEEEAV